MNVPGHAALPKFGGSVQVIDGQSNVSSVKCQFIQRSAPNMTRPSVSFIWS